jgi:hypothetical protein
MPWNRSIVTCSDAWFAPHVSERPSGRSALAYPACLMSHDALHPAVIGLLRMAQVQRRYSQTCGFHVKLNWLRLGAFGPVLGSGSTCEDAGSGLPQLFPVCPRTIDFCHPGQAAACRVEAAATYACITNTSCGTPKQAQVVAEIRDTDLAQ